MADQPNILIVMSDQQRPDFVRQDPYELTSLKTGLKIPNVRPSAMICV